MLTMELARKPSVPGIPSASAHIKRGSLNRYRRAVFLSGSKRAQAEQPSLVPTLVDLMCREVFNPDTVVSNFHQPDIRNLPHHFAVTGQRPNTKLTGARFIISVAEAMIDARAVHKMPDVHPQSAIRNREQHALPIRQSRHQFFTLLFHVIYDSRVSIQQRKEKRSHGSIRNKVPLTRPHQSQQAANDHCRKSRKPVREISKRSLVSRNEHTLRNHEQQRLQYKVKLKKQDASAPDFRIVSPALYLASQSKENKRNQYKSDKFIRAAVEDNLIGPIVNIRRLRGARHHVVAPHEKTSREGQHNGRRKQ